MGRNVDLTGKLGLQGKPTITYEGQTFTINDSATNVLLIMEEVGDGMNVKDAFKIADLLFEPASLKALKKLDLNLDDYITVVETALGLVTGDGEGEAATPDTTS